VDAAGATDGGTGVCLLYMGGPETLDQVEPFLLALFADRDLIRLPGGRLVQGPLGRFIARKRAPKVRDRYAQIGGGSPLRRITERQAELLGQALAPHGAFRVVVGMRYSAPRTAQALEELAAAGVSKVIALPLYPHFSSATTGSSFKDLDRALAARGGSDGWRVERVQGFYDHPRYVEALAGTVQRGLEELGGEAAVVFSAHSLPRELVEKRGDPYRDQVEATVAAVVERLDLPRWELGYQSRSGPVRWLEPDVLELVARHGEARTPALLVVPVSFVSDHIETLHEIDIEMRAFALARGVGRFARAPSLNEDPTFIQALTEVVLETCQTIDRSS